MKLPRWVKYCWWCDREFKKVHGSSIGRDVNRLLGIMGFLINNPQEDEPCFRELCGYCTTRMTFGLLPQIMQWLEYETAMNKGC